MESSTSVVLLESSCEGLCSPQWEAGVKDAGNLACAAAGCGLSDVRSRAEDAHNRSTATRKLGIAVILCLIFIAVEVTGGLFAHSLAVLTDAAHLLSDVAGFAISLFAIWASSWEATPRQSYGFFRLEILGALLSIQLIWLLTGIIVYEAINRMIHSIEQVNGRLMFLVATFGFFVNVIMVFLLGHHGHGHDHHGRSHDEHGHSHHSDSHHGPHHAHGHANTHSSLLPSFEEHAKDQIDEDVHDHVHLHDHSHHLEHIEDERQGHPLLVTQEPRYAFEEMDRRESLKVDIDIKQGDSGEKGVSKASNINVKGAWLHVLGDLIQSIGVMIGGAIIWVKPEWKVIDLICTLFFSVIVLATTIKILRDIMEVLMESTPREIDAKKLEKGLCEIPGVIAIHDLHIWAITMGKTLLACHVTIYSDADADAVLQRVVGYCDDVFNISHVTVQIERQRRRSPFDK